MDTRHEELAALNALGMLESDESRVLSGVALADKELRELITELEAVAAGIGRLVPPAPLPADLKKRVRAKLRERGVGRFSISPATLFGITGWVAAAALAAVCFWLWQERLGVTRQLEAASKAIAAALPAAQESDKAEVVVRTLEEELKKIRDDFQAQKTALETEIQSLRDTEKHSKAEIARLTQEVEAHKLANEKVQWQLIPLKTDVWEYRRGTGLIVWDAIRQHGLITLEKMTQPEAGKDFHLWVIDPKLPEPVSAGSLKVDEKGAVKTEFQADAVGSGPVKFVITMEKKDGPLKKEGKTVFQAP